MKSLFWTLHLFNNNIFFSTDAAVFMHSCLGCVGVRVCVKVGCGGGCVCVLWWLIVTYTHPIRAIYKQKVHRIKIANKGSTLQIIIYTLVCLAEILFM